MTSSFSQLGLKKDILSSIQHAGYNEPTAVQEKIIPLILSKKNVAFMSQTGSGKTLAYSIGFFSRLSKKSDIQLLIVVPTRELCLQVGHELKKFGDILNFKVGKLYGGRPIQRDVQTLSKKLQVVVGTPGRLIEHINAKSLKVGSVNSLVYDESDQMFDHGFYEDCTYIKSRVSSTAQIILSSATMTPKVEEFLKNNIKKYSFEQVGALIPPRIIQDVLFCDMKEKNKLLVEFFQGEEFSSAIVFVNTKAKVESIHHVLKKNNISTAMLSSDLDQKTREKCLRDFRNKKIAVLVCTDVASRGLDIINVEIIVNYDVPTRSELYIHRIGRSGRQGEKGYALTFICEEDEEKFMHIEDEFDLHVGEVNHHFELVNEE